MRSLLKKLMNPRSPAAQQVEEIPPEQTGEKPEPPEMKRSKKGKKLYWSYAAGDWSKNRVRAYEYPPASRYLYIELPDPANPAKRISRSLRHMDKPKAVKQVKEVAAKLAAGIEVVEDPTPTAARIFSQYETYQTRKKCEAEQKADARRIGMWTRALGGKKDLSKLTRYEWDKFIDQRRSGAIDANGSPVPEEKRKVVRDGTVAADCTFLMSVLNWATKWQDPRSGRYLMKENPARGFEIPREKNPRRPLATQDRLQKVRAAAPKVRMVVGRGKHRREMQSHLLPILDIVAGTGRRISAILALRHSDLKLDEGLYGAIVFPADTDKMGVERMVPMSAEVRAAIERIRAERPPFKPDAPLFPAPRNPSKPVRKDVADKWLLEAETLAEVPKQTGTLWHAYRRMWATAKKGFPVQDVAAAGGWKDLSTVQNIYQQPDLDTMYKVVMSAKELRGA